MLIKKDVEQNGMIGNLYYNKYHPEQKVFEVKKVKNIEGTKQKDSCWDHATGHFQWVDDANLDMNGIHGVERASCSSSSESLDCWVGDDCTIYRCSRR